MRMLKVEKFDSIRERVWISALTIYKKISAAVSYSVSPARLAPCLNSDVLDRVKDIGVIGFPLFFGSFIFLHANEKLQHRIYSSQTNISAYMGLVSELYAWTLKFLYMRPFVKIQILDSSHNRQY